MLRKMEEKIPLIKTMIPAVNALFSNMEFDFRIITPQQLDILFFTNYGDKRVSPLVSMFVEDSTISSDKMKELSSIILSYYKLNWNKMLDMIEIEYDPIHNFSDNLVEKIIAADDKTVKSENNIRQEGTGTKTRTDDLTSTETKNLTTTVNGTVEDKFAGLNSSSYSNKDNEIASQTTEETGTDTIVNTGTQSNKEERNFSDSSNGKEVTDDDYTRDRTLNRSGNIGNITTQQMLTQEIELWKWNFVQQILENVRDLTTIAVYF